MIIQGLLRSGKKIAIRSDGLHGLVYYTSAERKIALWTTESDIRNVTLPIAELNTPCCEFVDNCLVVCASNSSGTKPGRITECASLDSVLVVADTFEFGDAETRTGASCRTKTGAVFVNYRNTPGLSFDVCYRKSVVPIPNFQKWTTQRFDFPISRPGGVNVSMVEGADGLVWLFFTMDSHAMIGLIRFKLTDKVELVDYDGAFIPQWQPDSISPELPDVVAILDKVNSRIILGYQNAEGEFYPLPEPNPLGQAVLTSKGCCLTAVHPDKSRQLIASLPWENRHTSVPTAIGWGRPDGVYFITPYFESTTDYYDPATNSSGWKTGRVENGLVRIGSSEPGGKVISYSDDGWIVEQRVEGAIRESDLMKFRFKPILKVVKRANGVNISWDEPSLVDQLQSSSDLKTWTDVIGATKSPAVVANKESHLIFRLTQNIL